MESSLRDWRKQITKALSNTSEIINYELELQKLKKSENEAARLLTLLVELRETVLLSSRASLLTLEENNLDGGGGGGGGGQEDDGLNGGGTRRKPTTTAPKTTTGTVSAEQIILPFTEVLKSSFTPTQVKSMAVESLNRIVSCLKEKDLGASSAVLETAESIIECRFEQTGTNADEIAIIWLLETLRSCVNSEAGRLLTDQVLFRIAETIFDACVVPFNSEMVRTVALRFVCVCVCVCVMAGQVTNATPFHTNHLT